MSTARVVGLMIAWVLASVMIAVVTSILVTELLRFLGVVETGESSYTRSINVVFGVTVVALVAVPFVFRNRFARLSSGDQ